MKNKLNIIYGFITCIAIAIISTIIESLLPIHLIGSSIIALFIGIILNGFINTNNIKSGITFTSKKVLRFSIILLGASLNIQTILNVGRYSLSVMIFTLLTCFGVGYFIGKALGLDWKLFNLINAGTGICGGSAIAAIAPVIDAEDKQIAYAMSATFIFDMVMILAFPIMGHLLGLNDMAYGLWAGTAVNDTSSVVAAGYAFSENAGDFATMVKLTRTLSIIPVVLIFSYINIRLKRKEQVKASEVLDNVKNNATNYELSQTEKISEFHNNNFINNEKVHIIKLIPWFIVGFIGLAIINSFGIIPTNLSLAAKNLSKFLMVASLAAIGLKTSIRDMKSAGFKPMLHGFIISALVVVVAIIVEYAMGIC